MLSELGALAVTSHCCGPWPSRAKVGGLARMCESTLTSDPRRVDSVSGIHWGQFQHRKQGWRLWNLGEASANGSGLRWGGVWLGHRLMTASWTCFPGPCVTRFTGSQRSRKTGPPQTSSTLPPNPPCQALPCLWPGSPGPGPLPLNVSSLHTLFSALSMVPLTLRLI